MIAFHRITMEVCVVAPRPVGPSEAEGGWLDAAESTQSDGHGGLQMLRAR